VADKEQSLLLLEGGASIAHGLISRRCQKDEV